MEASLCLMNLSVSISNEQHLSLALRQFNLSFFSLRIKSIFTWEDRIQGVDYNITKFQSLVDWKIKKTCPFVYNGGFFRWTDLRVSRFITGKRKNKYLKIIGMSIFFGRFVSLKIKASIVNSLKQVYFNGGGSILCPFFNSL